MQFRVFEENQKNQNQRTIRSGYLKKGQNERTMGLRYLKKKRIKEPPVGSSDLKPLGESLATFMKEPAKKNNKRMVLWGNELENRDCMSELGI
jgi:hypothetical protein